MRFLELTVENFGVFRGTHHFKFSNDTSRNITVFIGHNGSGKSTIFQVMSLALYGSLSLGEALSQKTYHDFILNRMHRYPEELKQSSSDECAVSIRFQYVRSGQFSDIFIERRWQKHGHSIKEKIKVLEDNQTPDIDPADYQTWINDFISPGIGRLCFFDAEQLDALASQDQQSVILRESLSRLLGLDLVQRLESDLDQFMIRQGSTKKIDSLHAGILDLQSERDKIDNQLKQLDTNLEFLKSEIQNIEEAIAKQNRLLASEGGAYAARKTYLEDRLHIIDQEVETLSHQMQELTGDLLPFTLAPQLCIELYRALQKEQNLRQQHTTHNLLQRHLPEMETLFVEDDVWDKLGVPLEARVQITQSLINKLKAMSNPSDDWHLIHHLSEPEQYKVMRWISQVILELPQQIQRVGNKLQALKKEQRQIQADLQRAPSEEVLIPIHTEIKQLNSTLLEKKKQKDALQTQIGSLKFQRDEKQKALQEIAAQYEKVRRFEKQLKYAQGSKNVLRTYKDALIRQRLAELAQALKDNFNELCRKEHLLALAQIHPETFEVQLHTIDGVVLRLQDFSAGERQLYAMALLKALRQISRLALPLAIDTPLARLDEIHRLRIIRDYMPFVSEQVFLFTTDAEVDEKLLAEMQPQIASMYQLHHDSLLGETTITPRDFSVPENNQFYILTN